MMVGGIPMEKIQELVSEAIGVANNNNNVGQAPAPAAPVGLSANQQLYGSAGSVMWDDGERNRASNANYVASATNHPQVKQVIDALQSNKDILAHAKEIPPVRPVPLPVPVGQPQHSAAAAYHGERRKSLTGLLKKGYFGNLGREIQMKSY